MSSEENPGGYSKIFKKYAQDIERPILIRIHKIPKTDNTTL